MLVFGVLLLSVILVLGCTSQSKNEDTKPQTLEELKENKVNNPSEYDIKVII